MTKVGIAQYEVLIEGKPHPWHKDTITVPELRELGNLPVSVPIVEEDLRDGTERALPADVILHPGRLEADSMPTKRVNFRRA